MRRFHWIPLAAALAGMLLVWGGIVLRPPEPIRIGVLHSLSGTMAAAEAPLVDALRLALEEVNAGGGLLGRPLEMVVADSRSDEATAAAEALRLIEGEGVRALFGCWTSACRKAVKPVVEGHGQLLFYPLQYEGLEASPNIVYTGAAPNQQIIPAVRWALDHLGRSFYLVGSDYVFPRTANRIVRDLLAAGDGEVVGERYLPLRSLEAAETAEVAEEIVRLRPEVVVNTVNGDGNRHLLRALAEAGLDGEATTLLSFSLAEMELAGESAPLYAGHYAAWNYFQSIEGERNRDFVRRFRGRFGAERVVGDPMEAAYIALHLWARAVAEAESDEPGRVRQAVLRQSLAAPEGVVSVEPENGHLWKRVRIGRALPDGQFEIVWASEHPVEPQPFPAYHSRRVWRERMEGMAP